MYIQIYVSRRQSSRSIDTLSLPVANHSIHGIHVLTHESQSRQSLKKREPNVTEVIHKDFAEWQRTVFYSTLPAAVR